MQKMWMRRRVSEGEEVVRELVQRDYIPRGGKRTGVGAGVVM